MAQEQSDIDVAAKAIEELGAVLADLRRAEGLAQGDNKARLTARVTNVTQMLEREQLLHAKMLEAQAKRTTTKAEQEAFLLQLRSVALSTEERLEAKSYVMAELAKVPCMMRDEATIEWARLVAETLSPMLSPAEIINAIGTETAATKLISVARHHPNIDSDIVSSAAAKVTAAMAVAKEPALATSARKRAASRSAERASDEDEDKDFATDKDGFRRLEGYDPRYKFTMYIATAYKPYYLIPYATEIVDQATDFIDHEKTVTQWKDDLIRASEWRFTATLPHFFQTEWTNVKDQCEMALGSFGGATVPKLATWEGLFAAQRNLLRVVALGTSLEQQTVAKYTALWGKKKVDIPQLVALVMGARDEAKRRPHDPQRDIQKFRRGGRGGDRGGRGDWIGGGRGGDRGGRGADRGGRGGDHLQAPEGYQMGKERADGSIIFYKKL
jgi:hypothetical protein